MIGIGVLWALFAPLSLLALFAVLAIALYRLGRRFVLALVASALLVFVPVAAIWRSDHAAFEKICRPVARAVVRDRVPAKGFLLDSGTANSFGMRYLQEEGFSFVEARSIYGPGWVRYVRDARGTIVSSPIDQPTAAYVVHESFEQPGPSISVSTTTVSERNSGRELARAGSAIFDGGRANWVLGAWGVDSCPDPRTESDAFEAYYHLVRNTLR